MGFLTGNIPSVELEAFLGQPGCPVLLKPFELDEVVVFVRELTGCVDGDAVS